MHKSKSFLIETCHIEKIQSKSVCVKKNMSRQELIFEVKWFITRILSRKFQAGKFMKKYNWEKKKLKIRKNWKLVKNFLI